MPKLVLVVGPPRSGTSVTARLLHEKLNVCMGHKLYPGNPGNPLGFYEDSDIVKALRTKDIKAIVETIGKVHSARETLIGVKSPELAFIDMSLLNPSLVIRTRRNITDIARSLAKWRQPRIDHSKGYVLARHYEREIDQNFEHISHKIVYNLSLSPRRSERELITELEDALRIIGV